MCKSSVQLRYTHLVVQLTALFFAVQCFADKTTNSPTLISKPQVLLPKASFSSEEIGVVINTNEPSSVKLGEYYAKVRNIPKQNIVKLSFPSNTTTLTRKVFERVKKEFDRKTLYSVQALALVWKQPYRVDCMSITSAFAFGFNEAYCAIGCKPTKSSHYFGSNSHHPYTEHGIRPAMLLTADNETEIRELIQRGIKSDNSWPEGTGYLVKTADKNRNTRSYVYERLVQYTKGWFQFELVNANFIINKPNILFYFTGAIRVPYISKNTFLPGAIADHLTSAEGVLAGSDQMSSLEWISAGATGSFGTVVEPCNYPQKFPNPGIVASQYLQGATLIEAYWKSVEMPGQGLFIGEPLAKPFAGYEIETNEDRLHIQTYVLKPGKYTIDAAKEYEGPYEKIIDIVVNKSGKQTISVNQIIYPFYGIRYKSISTKHIIRYKSEIVYSQPILI